MARKNIDFPPELDAAIQKHVDAAVKSAASRAGQLETPETPWIMGNSAGPMSREAGLRFSGKRHPRANYGPDGKWKPARATKDYPADSLIGDL